MDNLQAFVREWIDDLRRLSAAISLMSGDEKDEKYLICKAEDKSALLEDKTMLHRDISNIPVLETFDTSAFFPTRTIASFLYLQR